MNIHTLIRFFFSAQVLVSLIKGPIVRINICMHASCYIYSTCIVGQNIYIQTTCTYGNCSHEHTLVATQLCFYNNYQKALIMGALEGRGALFYQTLDQVW